MREVTDCKACLKTFTRSYLHNTFHDRVCKYSSTTPVKPETLSLGQIVPFIGFPVQIFYGKDFGPNKLFALGRFSVRGGLYRKRRLGTAEIVRPGEMSKQEG